MPKWKEMQRRPIVAFLMGIGILAAFWLLLQTPGNLQEALSRPFSALVGTGEQLNSKLLDFSQYPEPIRAAGQRLLQPFGIVHLVKSYSAPDAADQSKKR